MIEQSTTDISKNNFVCPEGTEKCFLKEVTCETLKCLIKAFCPYYFNVHNFGVILRIIVFTLSPSQQFQNAITIPCVLSERKISAPLSFS